MKRCLAFCLLLGLLSSMAFAQEAADQSAFTRAYELAVKDKPSEALPQFEALLATHPQDPELLFNAGTTALLTGKLGPGVLYLERALALDPACADCRANLERARERQADRIVLNPADKVLKTSAVESVLDALNPQLLAGVLAALSLLITVLYLWRRFSRSQTRRFALGLALVVALLIEAGLGALTWFTLTQVETQRYAVVMSVEVQVRKGPNPNYPEAFKVHEGLKVRLGERLDDYVQIFLPNGLNGYVPARDLNEI